MNFAHSLKLFSLTLPIATYAQTVWIDGGGDASWSNSSNWSSGVPTSTSQVQIGTQPTADLIGIDTGSITNTVASFTFNNTLTGPITVLPLATETLTVTGAITNNSGFTHSFQVQVDAGGNATWSGPLNFQNIVNISTRSISLSGNLTFSGPALNFDITSALVYGRFLGAGTTNVSGVTVNIGGSYSGNAGDTFDLTTSNFTGATLGTLPTLSGGLTWNTSQFLSQGILTVSAIPEPAMAASLLALGAVGFVATRRRLRKCVV